VKAGDCREINFMLNDQVEILPNACQMLAIAATFRSARSFSPQNTNIEVAFTQFLRGGAYPQSRLRGVLQVRLIVCHAPAASEINFPDRRCS
jgi:hypothetical protein